jgi:tripartite-type tricarboxylate transporter receptor subunit TctC
VVVDNRAGAGGALGTDVVAKAAPDGHTIGLGTSSQLVMNVGLHKALPFDVERDLRLIGLVGRTPMLLAASAVVPGSPKSIQELITQAKARPGTLSYGSAGLGSISHIVAEAFAKAADIQLLHVPYKGNGPALIDLSGGHVNLLFDGFVSSAPVAAQGRATLLAVSGQKRSSTNPNVPTFAEQGLPNYEATTWNNLFAPARTPADVVARLNDALNRALATQALKDRLAQGASESLGPSTPEQADAYGQAQRAQWVPFVRALGIDAS